MADASRHLRVQAKLKELIERAFSAADANLHRRIKPYPLGFAVRANGSKFAFRPENIEDNDAAVAHIRTLFLQHNVVCYILTLAAVSKGKQYVFFSAEDESGTMVVGHREIICSQLPIWGHSKSSRVILQRDDLSVCFRVNPQLACNSLRSSADVRLESAKGAKRTLIKRAVVSSEMSAAKRRH
jgi:hypothetical protein